MVRLQLETRVI